MFVSIGGGALMGFGAKLARGCTSGQALTGGALLSAGSWIFIAMCFASGYFFAPLAGGQNHQALWISAPEVEPFKLVMICPTSFGSAGESPARPSPTS